MTRKIPSVSVVLPIYGDFDSKRLEMSVLSVMEQKDVDLEVIVAEQNDVSKLEFHLPGIVHVFSDQSKLPTSEHYSPGGIRNIGLASVSNEFVYTNDSDIVFLNDRFLANLLERMQEEPELAFMRPPMRRMPLSEFEVFYSIVQEQGISEAIAQLSRNDPHLCTVTNEEHDFKQVSGRGKHVDQTFTVPMVDFESYRSGEDFQGEEPKIFLENLHRGGNLLRSSQVRSVGGYHEMYRRWGCEDSDLQLKIGEFFRLECIPKLEQFEVLHLDHSKGYFDRDLWMANEALLELRKNMGLTTAAKDDNLNWRVKYK